MTSAHRLLTVLELDLQQYDRGSGSGIGIVGISDRLCTLTSAFGTPARPF